ncbi:MAG: hypothetical protein K5829_06225 [Treponema sp.]|nr:hypothetical protein [Treponema sp.]
MKKFFNQIRKSIFIFLIFFLGISYIFGQDFSSNNNAQNQRTEDFYQKVYFTAQKLEEAGAFKEAATEYKRYLFLQEYSRGIFSGQALTALSRLYRNNGSLNLALDYNLQAQNYFINSGEENGTWMEGLKLCEIELLELLDLTFSSTAEKKSVINPRLYAYAKSEKWSQDIRKKAYSAILKNQIRQKEWKSADITFKAFSSDFPETFPQEKIAIFNACLIQAENFKYKNPKTATYLSFIPGLGQFYAGDYTDSLNAFILNGALIGVSLYSLINLQFQDFILLEASPTLRFYRGNFRNAYKAAEEWNKEEIAILQNKLIAILEID